jgi:hypothetical protein
MGEWLLSRRDRLIAARARSAWVVLTFYEGDTLGRGRNLGLLGEFLRASSIDLEGIVKR